MIPIKEKYRSVIICRSFLLCLLTISLFSCKEDESFAYGIDEVVGNSENRSVKILSLGDSYTIGESVCDECGFPPQLQNRLYNSIQNINIVELQVIAQTGWTTGSLLTAIANQNPSTDFNLVTLLIGVNNQYQGIPFEVYEIQFPQLVELAISKAGGRADKLIVVSIPDYAYTPFGQAAFNPGGISQEVDAYNAFAEAYCAANNISFVNITDISRQGLEVPALVASDGLHPSEEAYSRFVDRILPVAIEKIE